VRESLSFVSGWGLGTELFVYVLQPVAEILDAPQLNHYFRQQNAGYLTNIFLFLSMLFHVKVLASGYF
jgi:hypothetical protein